MSGNNRCPYCGSSEFIEAKQSGIGEVVRTDTIFIGEKRQVLYYEICLKCGSVVRSFVKNPEKLVK